MHMYFEGFDWLSDDVLEEALPEDGVPDELNFNDLPEDIDHTSLTEQDFVDWMTEGQHDLDVARTLTYAWCYTLRGSDNDSLPDLFTRIVQDT